MMTFHAAEKGILCVLAALAVAVASAVAAEQVQPPPNAPAAVEWNAGEGRLALRYRGGTILDAAISAEDAEGREVDGVRLALDERRTGEDKVAQRLTLALAEPQGGITLRLRGKVTGSKEAFPAEAEPGKVQKRFPCVRTSVGPSRSLRNHAVYDRRWDWVLFGPADDATRIQPAGEQEDGRTFTWESRGERIELVFRPRFYQKHKGFRYFEPWTYDVWKDSVTGYCTWWSYRAGFTQETLDAMLAVFTEKRLPDFGYTYMQLDNCYQKGNGSAPWNWLKWDKRKYPGGWKDAMRAIRDAGMKPGIWVHRVHRPSDPGVKDVVERHPDWFVPGADGKPHHQHGFVSLNTLKPEAVDTMIRDLYRGLAEQGWDYVKIDGTGDLLRAYRNKACADFFETHPTTPEQSLRTWDVIAREELGPDVYILACHTVGNCRVVIGLVDGGRLSNDGFQPRTLAQYNFLEGVVWRGDPDHCDVMGTWLMDEDAEMPVFGLAEPVPVRTVVRPAICTMAGAVLMVSDKAEIYQDDRNIEGMKRSAPVLFTRPGQLYGHGRRPMSWWLQEIDRPFGHWSVLARIQWGEKEKDKHVYHFDGEPEQEVAFADLGIPADRPYRVYEFWSQRFLGTFKGSFTAPAMGKNDGMDAFAIREARAHPWVLSTSRHLAQGGVSLSDVTWDAKRRVLSGTSAVVVGDPYVLTVHVPEGYRLQGAEAVGEPVHVAARHESATVRIVPSATKTVDWTITFAE
jgi:hypothetical protein